MKKKSIILIILVVMVALLAVMIPVGVVAFLVIGTVTSEVEVYTDVADYEIYMTADAEDERFRNKWGMDETIFPESIAEDMNVQDYKMVYYNPWDAQYLSYLVVEYDETDYQEEVERLQAYESTEYVGYYGVTGFDEDYALLAMYADDYQGFVYALTDKEDAIIYVELIFCNYFMDLEYENYMPTEYFPTGFDATNGNAYEKEKMAEVYGEE